MLNGTLHLTWALLFHLVFVSDHNMSQTWQFSLRSFIFSALWSTSQANMIICYDLIATAWIQRANKHFLCVFHLQSLLCLYKKVHIWLKGSLTKRGSFPLLFYWCFLIFFPENAKGFFKKWPLSVKNCRLSSNSYLINGLSQLHLSLSTLSETWKTSENYCLKLDYYVVTIIVMRSRDC